jgi:Lipopolysaccharide-assembly, LptC-related
MTSKSVSKILIATLFLSCENDMKTVLNLNTKLLGVETGKNIISYLSTAGKVKAQLTAPIMYRYENDSAKLEFPNTLRIKFYDSLLQPESFLFAKYGRYLEFDNTVLLRDSIVIYNNKNDSLWTNEIYWDQNMQIFYTNTPVVISQNNGSYRQKIIGRNGFRSDQNLKNFTMFEVGRMFNPNVESFIILKDSVK